jgi:hypothetical protein
MPDRINVLALQWNTREVLEVLVVSWRPMLSWCAQPGDGLGGDVDAVRSGTL